MTNVVEQSNIFPYVGAYLGKGPYTEHAGLEISVNSRIASPFSRHIAIGNAGPSTALDSMGGKQSFRCHSFNIALM